MLCNVCKESIEGIWDVNRSTRIAKREALEEKYGSPHDIWPGPMWAEYWATFSESKQDLKDLEPSECVFAHHRNMASLMASRQDGCAICNRLHQEVTSYEGWSQGREKDPCAYFSMICVEYDGYNDDKLIISFYTRSRLSKFRFYNLEGTNCSRNDGTSDASKNGTTNNPRKDHKGINLEHDASTDSLKTWSIVDGWMKECTESHEVCRELGMPPYFRPTRLLEMNESDSFRLVLGSQCPPDVQFAALSYCWGPKPAHSLLRLLRSTLNALSEWQPVSGLPKTFRDAMHIAQRLGLRYLWIDRLCIFQDSAGDWSHEASTMQDVYRSAYIGIGALSAKDDEGGCFFERDPANVSTALTLKTGRDSESIDLVYAGNRKYKTWRYTFEHEPLCKRSWVVQERLLAARTLYFGSKQVFWECRTITCCEFHPKGMDPSGGRSLRRSTNQLRSHLWKRLLASGDTPTTDKPQSQLMKDWEIVVELYASLQLTIPSDKLIALSGLANDMKRRLAELQPGSHRYLAGLWEVALMTQLCWSTTSPAKRASQYRAPSWSWACLDGHLQFPRSLFNDLISDNMFDLATTISAEMLYLGEEETGEVKSGVLTLEGPCMWAKVESGASWLTLGSSTRNKSEVSVTFDTLNDETEDVLLLWTFYFNDSPFGTLIRGLALTVAGNERYRRIGVIGSNDRGEEGLIVIKELPQARVSII